MSAKGEKQKRIPIGTAARMAANYERRQLALSLRIKGMSYTAIAQSLRKLREEDPEKYHFVTPMYSHPSAFKDVNDELEKQARENAQSAQALKEIELQRLDRWQTMAEDRLSQPDERLASVNTLVRLSESRRRLTGLDEPVKTEVAGPKQGPVVVQRVLNFEGVEVDELQTVLNIMRKAIGGADVDIAPAP